MFFQLQRVVLDYKCSEQRFVLIVDGQSVSSFGISYVAMEDLDDTLKVLSIEGHKPPANADAKSPYPLLVK